jgi:phosphinothricin acetyltransferase
LQAGIFPENTASLTLHERAGFRRLGVQEKIGKHGDRGWRDVVRLERRSPNVY